MGGGSREGLLTQVKTQNNVMGNGSGGKEVTTREVE